MSRKRSIIQKARITAQENGIKYLVSMSLGRIKNHIYNIPTIHIPFLYYKLFMRNRTFSFQQKKYNYFIKEYNTTWRTERAVEIPIVCQVIGERKGKILEVGNVLSHYFNFEHDIVDKYEKGEGVNNQDVTTLDLKDKYDLILSISTLEHVGWDEKNPRKG